MRRLLDITGEVLLLVGIALLVPFGILLIGLPIAGVAKLLSAAFATLLGGG